MPRGVNVYDEARLQGRLWTPAVARPALWLDSFDLSSIRTVTGVSEWRDKSGNSRHFTQSDTARQPSLNYSLGPNPSILWDGSNDSLQRIAESWAFVYPVSFFVSLRAVSWTNAYNSPFEFYTEAGPATAGWSYFVKSNGKSACYTNDTAGTQRNYDGTGALTFSTGTTNVLCGTIGNGFINTWGNGVVDGTVSGTWTQRTNLGTLSVDIGSGVKFNRFTNWRIYEAVIFTGSTLSNAFRQSMEGYMAWRAAAFGDTTGIRNLPASHPFRNRPPLIGS
jgi:hypothetical protein